MKIAHLTSAHPIHDSRIFHKECKTLAARGYDVTLIAPHHQDCEIEGIQIRAIKPTYFRLKRMSVSIFAVYKAALQEQADIYHFHDPELIPIGLLLKCRGKKVIYDAHEDFPKDMLDKKYIPSWLRPPLSKLTSCIEKIAARLFNKVITVTPAIAEKFSSKKTILIRNFPILSEFNLTETIPYNNREHKCIYVGSINQNRGLKEMMAAVSFVPTHLKVNLQLAGKFQPDALLQQATEYLGWDRVNYLGYLHRHAISKYLQNSRIGLLLLQPIAGYLESYPIKLFEYMAAGLPVIASDFPVWRDIIEKYQCGILLDPNDTQSIANSIEYLITHPDEAEAMGKNGQRACEKLFNWNSEAEKLVNTYLQLER